VAHPREVLLGAQARAGVLPVCDHYSGVEARMRKSLQLQADMVQEFGTCVFDVTLDCEDGAPVGGEADQAALVAALALQVHAAARSQRLPAAPRVGVRLHAVHHAAFLQDVQAVVGTAASALSFVMVPKVESVADVDTAVGAIDAAARQPGRQGPAHMLPLHVLVESPAAVQQVFAIAAHPRVESISFGLMDFVSAHGGASPASAMGFDASSASGFDGSGAADRGAAAHALAPDQFHHPLVVRAKAEIASACHAHGKVPSHCVVTEFRDAAAVERAARLAANTLGYTRMWSIHPDQIRPILRAFTPAQAEVELAARVVLEAQRQDWAPIAVGGTLHDRASYRYFWQVLERAHQTGCTMPAEVVALFAPVPSVVEVCA
jgi:citrate lyase subunit beta/citryl-CoA lyase